MSTEQNATATSTTKPNRTATILNKVRNWLGVLGCLGVFFLFSTLGCGGSDSTSSSSESKKGDPREYGDQICREVERQMAGGSPVSAGCRGKADISFGSRNGDKITFRVFFTPSVSYRSESIWAGTLFKDGSEWKFNVHPVSIQ